MLLELKQYLKQQPMTSLTDLATRFNTSEDVMKSMLQRLGRPIQQVTAGSVCGGCRSSCGACPLKKVHLSKKIAVDGN